MRSRILTLSPELRTQLHTYMEPRVWLQGAASNFFCQLGKTSTAYLVSHSCPSWSRWLFCIQSNPSVGHQPLAVSLSDITAAYIVSVLSVRQLPGHTESYSCASEQSVGLLRWRQLETARDKKLTNSLRRPNNRQLSTFC